MIYTGNGTGLAVLTDGTLWSWGANDQGVLGLGLPYDPNLVSLPFTQVGTDNDWTTKIRFFGAYVLAIKNDGSLWGWGSNTQGQIGNGTFGNGNIVTAPQLISIDEWIDVATGQAHSIGIKSDGSLWSWGKNDNHQLGLGSSGPTGPQPNPTRVGTANDWVKVFCTLESSLAIKTDGTLWVWGAFAGHSFDHQVDWSVPVQIGTDTDWEYVSGTFHFCMAIKSDGTLWAWGPNPNSNYPGHYGNGYPDTNIYQNGPIQVGNDSDWQKVQASTSSVTALKADGTVWVWGYNHQGILGLGDSVNRFTPQQIGNENNWIDISADKGNRLKYAKNQSGEFYRWGAYFQDWDNPNVIIPTPVLFGEPCELNTEIYPGRKFTVYPNPAESDITVLMGDVGLYKAVLYNSLGQPVFENHFEQEAFTIDMSRYGSGVYFLIVANGENLQQFKIVRK